MNILITGANGFLGGKIAGRITKYTDYDVLAVASSQDKVFKMCEREKIDPKRMHFISNETFLNPDTELTNVFGAVHLAFSRMKRPASEIAASVSFAAAVFNKLSKCGIDRVINMSTQGVYGQTEEIRTEKTPPAPENIYTMAKYSTEIMFDDIMKNCQHHTSLRLDLVAQSQNVLKGLCESAVKGEISLKGGRQVFSFIDGDDVAPAVLAMLEQDGEWESIYNVGWSHKRYTLIELAGIVADVAEKCLHKRPEIMLAEADISLWAGMDSGRFMDKTGWEPKISLKETIEKMLEIY